MTYTADERRRRHAEAKRRYRQRHPERVREADSKRRAARSEALRAYNKMVHLRQYGLTQDAYYVLLEDQGGKCAICGTLDSGGLGSFRVDHNHGTGAVRGLLCNNCNVGIGMMKDDPAVLMAAAQYLVRHSNAQ